ncbi:hypothetical protein C5E45_18260 [Nocardia nova]|uniref:DUF3558 domain-containing protein n=1 Tax=Nocardia nova TaxID=37330 RepID=A0A2S6ANH3_9NOCA|nr:DUF3558 domain-containing protein [Nocardia nova]PPJ36759.1 hypothetical protein C5E45_18260 [Nocardia nova]
MRRIALYYLPLAVTAAMVAACSTSDGDISQSVTDSASATTDAPSNAATRPTLTASQLQPPSQVDEYTRSSGRPQVAFDPCTWIPDEAVTRAGFDPRSRKRGDDQVAEITFLICNFSAKNKTLTVMSGNATWDEDSQKNGSWSEPLTINGREARWVRDPALKRGCDIHLRTRSGFVDIGVTLTADGVIDGMKPCDGLETAASEIEPAIGKDN